MAQKKKTLAESLKEVLGQSEDEKIEAIAEEEVVEDKADGDGDDDDDDDDDDDKKKKSKKQVDETTALDSLHPAARPVTDDPKSKIETIARTIGHINAMSSADLTKWYTQSIAQSKTYADKIPGGSAKSNESSIDMKPSDASISKGPKTEYPMPKLGVKEDVEEMLKGFELSEDFKDQATTLFEAAVTARVLIENAKLEEQFEAKLEEAVEQVAENLADQVDNYLTYVVEHFMEENEVAIESSLRNELMDGFIAGLHELFTNHNFSVPETKVDVVEALADKVQDLEAKFNEQLEENTQLREALVEVERERLVESYIEDLALSEADKFVKLAEGVDFDGDLEAYSKKLSIIKENYFGEKKTAKSNIEEESFEGTTSEVKMDPTVAKYMDLISRQVKS
jgi:hypothetical protein